MDTKGPNMSYGWGSLLHQAELFWQNQRFQLNSWCYWSEVFTNWIKRDNWLSKAVAYFSDHPVCEWNLGLICSYYYTMNWRENEARVEWTFAKQIVIKCYDNCINYGCTK